MALSFGTNCIIDILLLDFIPLYSECAGTGRDLKFYTQVGIKQNKQKSPLKETKEAPDNIRDAVSALIFV